MSRVLGNILSDLDPKVKVNNVISCKCIFSLTMGCSNMTFCWCRGHIKSRVLGNILCDLDLGPGVKVK